MKIPAIRAKIGIWVYYIATLTFSQIKEFVKPVVQELHKSEALRDMLQRNLTKNYKSIAEYIAQQDERFFNSLVLAVYDGDPQWHEIRLDYGEQEEYYDIGILELTGNEKIFPVDGQHRVEGIKEVLKNSSDFNMEKVPVIFIGHRTDDDGMKRARRMFSTLNRYAKPVSQSDIIALDEDDAIAIVTRDMVESHILCTGNRILGSKTKAIPESDTKSFTSIITFYECNRELLRLFLIGKDITDADGRMVKSRKNKLAHFIKYRPAATLLEEYTNLCYAFWDAFTSNIDDIQKYTSKEASTKEFRNRNGGNILFRPVALIPVVKAVIRIHSETTVSFEDIFKRINLLPLSLVNEMWTGILWDKINNKMVPNNQVIVELLILKLYDVNLLQEKDKEMLITKFASAKQISNESAAKEIGLG